MDPFSLLLVGGLALILIVQFSRVRRQQRAVRETQAGVEVGTEVLTAAGMIATVVAVGEATVTLRGPDGDLSRWVKGAVIRVLPDTDPASSRYQAPVGTSSTDGTSSTGTSSTGTISTDGTSSSSGTGATDTGAVDDDGAPRHQD